MDSKICLFEEQMKYHTSYDDVKLYLLLINCLQQDRYEESKKKWCRLNLYKSESLIIKKHPNLFCMQMPKENSTFKFNACFTGVTVKEFEVLISKIIPIKEKLEEELKKPSLKTSLKVA